MTLKIDCNPMQVIFTICLAEAEFLVEAICVVDLMSIRLIHDVYMHVDVHS